MVAEARWSSEDVGPAFERAGLMLAEEPGEDGRPAFVVSGNTYPNKEILKRHGGRWSGRRMAWVFDDPERLREVAAVVAANGAAAPADGLGDAPATYEADPPSFPDLRKKAQNAGHRNRLRQRFLEAGAASLPDYELLELLLFFAIDVKDTKPLAKDLLARCGSLGGVLRVEPAQLAEFADLKTRDPEVEAYNAYRLSDRWQEDRDLPDERLSEEGRRWRAFERDRDGRWEVIRLIRRRETLILLRAIQELLERVLRERIKEREVIGSWSALIDYLQVALAHEPIEQFRVLFLDRKNILLRDEVQQRGTVDHTPLYPRELAKRALELGASAVIMVHNHPSGDPTPSRADIEMTRQVVQALTAVSVSVHDHVIVGKNRHTSFKSQRLI